MCIRIHQGFIAAKMLRLFIFNRAVCDVTLCLVQIREQLQAELNRYKSRITDLECVLSQQGQVILQHFYTPPPINRMATRAAVMSCFSQY